MMSCCTLGVAEAVRVSMGAWLLIESMASRSRRYSGLKSWPHSEIQCASSMAKNEMGSCCRNSMVSSLLSVSGATYRSFVPPSSRSSFTSLVCAFESEEFKKWATHSRPAV